MGSNILDKVKKTTHDAESLTENVSDKDETEHLVLAVTYKGGDQEIFYLEKETAKSAALELNTLLQSIVQGLIPKGCIDIYNDEEAKDYRGTIVVNKDTRTIRLIKPEPEDKI